MLYPGRHYLKKIKIIRAQSKLSSADIPRLGFQDFYTEDGPHRVHLDVLWDDREQSGQTNDSCIAFLKHTC